MSDMFIPSDPKVMRFEKLSLGMQTDRPTHQLEPGAGLNIERLYCDSRGLTKTRGIHPYIQTSDWGRVPMQFTGELITNMLEYAFQAGSVNLGLVSTRLFYKSNATYTAFEPVPWVRDYTASSVVGTTVTISGANLTTDNVVSNMYARFNVTGVGYEWRLITVTDATHFDIDSALSSTLASTTFQLYKLFGANLPLVVQYAVTPSAIIFCDGTQNNFQQFDGTWMSKWTFVDENATASDCIGASAITYFQGRLWVGNTIESGVNGRRRIRWSDVSDLTTLNSSNWEDFIESSGVILGFSSYEDYLITCTQDHLWMGTPYGYDATLVKPFVWRRLETGNVGIVGPRAITTIPNGLIYMGRDDIYVIDGTKFTAQGEFVVHKLTCPIRDEMLRDVSSKPATVVKYDPETECVLFGINVSEPTNFAELFIWSLRTQGWSHTGAFPIGFTTLEHLRISASETWTSMRATGDDWADVRATGRTWFDMLGGFGETTTLLVDINGVIYRYSKSFGQDTYVLDDNSTVVSTPTLIFETGDMDFGEPDAKKVAYKFAMRIDEVPNLRATDLTFTLHGSTDLGQSWKTLGVLNYAPNQAEQEVHFRLNGTNLRFKITSTNDVAELILSELTLRVRLSGRQVVRSE